MTDTKLNRDPRERIDYSPRSGSADSDSVEWDQNAPTGDDGRTAMHTRFNPSEADDSNRYGDLHDEHETRESQQAAIEADRRRDAATWCNSLDFTDFQRDRVLYLIDRLDIEPLRGYQYDASHAILAVIVHVALDDNRYLVQIDVYSNKTNNVEASSIDDGFQTICDHVGATPTEVVEARNLLIENITEIA